MHIYKYKYKYDYKYKRSYEYMNTRQSIYYPYIQVPIYVSEVLVDENCR